MEKIREFMKEKNYDGIIIPTADPHQNEYPAPKYLIREALTGFTGSAGTLVVTKDKAGLWTDGRYELQGREELKGTGIDLYCTAYPDTTTIGEFLSTLDDDSVVVVDGNRFSLFEYEKIEKEIAPRKILGELNSDDLWQGPELSDEPIFLPEAAAAGGDINEKLIAVRKILQKDGQDGVLIGASEDIAWLFNLRGKDVPMTPVFYAYAWIDQDKAILFIDKNKLTTNIKEYLSSFNIEVLDYNDVRSFLEKEEGIIRFDTHRTNQKNYEAAKNSQRQLAINPTTLLKAIKTDEEIEYMKKAHIKDGIALTKFFRWLEDNGAGKTELEISNILTDFRAEDKSFYEPSFTTIAGYGANGAIIHYSPGENSAIIENKGLFLIDSGGQYDCGTTDITRTVAMGELTEEMKRDYTYVLKAHINLAKAKFLEGTRGIVLDGFCRYPLWEVGLDYKHGTGHGIGYMLSVHEGPMSISTAWLDQSIDKGQILSIEPGIYRQDKYGVRIENLTVIVEAEKNNLGTFLKFEEITYAHIDTRPIDLSLMTQEELRWLNSYHEMVYNKLSPYLDEEDKEYLRIKTRAIY